METLVSVASKVRLEDYVTTEGLSQETQNIMLRYLLTLYNLSEGKKEQYLLRLGKYGLWLIENGFESFEEAEKEDVIAFLNSLMTRNTVNAYITMLKPFYRFLNKPEVVKDLKFCNEDLQPITPSEVLAPEEVVAIAEECGKRRDMYKVMVLILFESCARISEVLHLRKGDVQFSSVRDKEYFDCLKKDRDKFYSDPIEKQRA
jgi:site-specific recombinase XerD